MKDYVKWIKMYEDIADFIKIYPTSEIFLSCNYKEFVVIMIL
jgi:hypothetical protein